MFTSLEAGGIRVIISSDSLTLGGKDLDIFPADKTYIYANHCILGADVTAKELHLHTASFTAIGVPTFNLAGEKGKDDVSGKAVINGGEGHNFYFSSASFDYKSRFKVNVTGGNGGQGYTTTSDGKGGTGGNGGHGGMINILYEDNYQRAINGYSEYHKARTAADKTPSRSAELAVKQAAKDWIELLHVAVQDPEETLDKIKALRAELNKEDEFGRPKITISLKDLEFMLELGKAIIVIFCFFFY